MNFVVGPCIAWASRKSFLRPFEYARMYFAAPESSNRRDVADKVELESVALLAFERATSRSSDLLTSGRQDDGLAGRLRVEEPVGFLGPLEPPAVGEEPLHVHLALGDELGALGLALLRERPRPHQRDLPAQEIRADVERDLTPLADETGDAPRAYGAQGRGTGVRRRGGVERLVRALAVRQLGNRRDHAVRGGIDHLGGSELLGKLAPLGRDVDGDDARAHLDGQQVARMSEAKSGISRLNARPAMAGVRHSPGGDT